jgi:hypothetical protein
MSSPSTRSTARFARAYFGVCDGWCMESNARGVQQVRNTIYEAFQRHSIPLGSELATGVQNSLAPSAPLAAAVQVMRMGRRRPQLDVHALSTCQSDRRSCRIRVRLFCRPRRSPGLLSRCGRCWSRRRRCWRRTGNRDLARRRAGTRCRSRRWRARFRAERSGLARRCAKGHQ